MTQKILVAASHPGGANAVIPVAKRLAAEGIEVRLLGTNSTDAALKATGLPYTLVDTDPVQLLPIDFHEISALLLGSATQTTENGLVLEQLLTVAARGKVPTLALVDLPISEVARFSDLYDGQGVLHANPDENPRGKFAFLPDRIAADGFAHERMLAQGFPSDKLVITGNPSFDDLNALVANAADCRRYARKMLGVNENQRVVLYVSDVTQDLENLKFGFKDKDCINAVCRGLLQLPSDSQANAVLVLRKHPRESQSNFDELCRTAADYHIQLRTSSYNNRHDILGSDLVVSIVSTMLFEATLLNKDALSIQPNADRALTDDYFLNKIHAIPHAYGGDACSSLIKRAITDQGFMKDYRERRQGLRIDGKATERVVEQVYRLLNA